MVLTMAKLAVVYGTTEGQTAKIANRIVAVANEHDHIAQAYNAQKGSTGFELSLYDAIIVGASLHVGSYQKSVENFIKAHLTELRKMPNAFFSVSLAAADPSDKNQRALAECANKLQQRTGWYPQHVVQFAGALKYQKYSWWQRLIMKWIAKSAGGDTDTSRDYEYTNWHEVDKFTLRFLIYLSEKEQASAAT